MVFRSRFAPLISALTPVVCFLYFLAKYRSTAYFAMGLVVLAGYFLLYFRWRKLVKFHWERRR